MAQEYVHRDSIGELKNCRGEALGVRKLLEPLYLEGKLKGYYYVIIKSHENAKEKLIYSDYNKISQDRFPFLFLSVELAEINPVLDQNIRERGYIRLF